MYNEHIILPENYIDVRGDITKALALLKNEGITIPLDSLSIVGGASLYIVQNIKTKDIDVACDVTMLANTIAQIEITPAQYSFPAYGSYTKGVHLGYVSATTLTVEKYLNKPVQFLLRPADEFDFNISRLAIDMKGNLKVDDQSINNDLEEFRITLNMVSNPLDTLVRVIRYQKEKGFRIPEEELCKLLGLIACLENPLKVLDAASGLS